ncbi:MAG: hypothetical protein IKL14_04740 [Alphaproteobacteria bacterium]|nr:hypothetical protein [Alphaproteobacteria bacterium]
MQIKIEHLDAENAWNHILDWYNLYQSSLKNFNRPYSMFAPEDPRMQEMFARPKLSNAQIKYYHDIFISEIYNQSDLTKRDHDLNTAVQMFQNMIETKIKPLLPAWNAKMPKTLTIECEYGRGAGYKSGNNATIMFRMSNDNRNDYRIYLLLSHEFVHILIGEQIIQKYNVPHDLKERIVDIIGQELFKKPVQPMFENSFANAYITPEVIRTDLDSAVKKMMADYTALKQAQTTKDR